jgi:hypothetical protein
MSSRRLIWRHLIVPAAAIAALSGFPAQAASAAPAGWRLVYQLPKTGQQQLVAITAPGRTSAWAVGGSSTSAIVLRWNGRFWRRVSLPHVQGEFAFDVQASSPNNVWIAASNGSSVELERWNGASWQAVPAPAAALSALHVISPRDVWAASLCPAPAGSPPCSILWHWDGTSWYAHKVRLNVSSLAGVTADNVWAVGVRGLTAAGPLRIGRPYALRWDGQQWRSVSMPAPRIQVAPVAAVAASGRVWVGIVPRTGRACALQRSGTHWATLTPAVDQGPCSQVVPDGRGGAWFGPFMHWTGSRWAQTQRGFPFQGQHALFLTGLARISGSQALLLTGNMNPNTHTAALTQGFIAADGTLPS